SPMCVLRQRKIDVESESRLTASLSCVPGEVGKRNGGIAVNGYEQHIVPVVEDILRAVSVMKVDVEDGDTLCAAIDRVLRSNRCVVQIAVSPHVFAAGVM